MLRQSTGLRTGLLGGSSGGSLQSLLAGGVLRIFSGTQPTNADAAETGTLLAEITLGGAAFTPGTPSTNGLSFDDPVNAELHKAAAEDWQGIGLATTNAGWFRFYSSSRVTGATTTGVHFDGSIATSGGQITMSNTSISIDVPLVVNSFKVVLPES